MESYGTIWGNHTLLQLELLLLTCFFFSPYPTETRNSKKICFFMLDLDEQEEKKNVLK